MAKNEERYLLQALEFEADLRAYLHRHTRIPAEVEELLQETYARLLTAGCRDEPEVRSVRGFALTIARNVVFDSLRHRRIMPIEAADMEALEVLDDRPQVDEIVSGHQELALLVSAVQGLPERCRQVFTLRKIYGYTQKQIATRLQISEDTVEADLTKAARRCAEALFDLPAGQQRGAFTGRTQRSTGAHANGG